MQNQDRLILWGHFGHLPDIFGFCNFGKSKRMYINVQFFQQQNARYPGSRKQAVYFFKPRSAPEVSPVLTLGICCKGQERTRLMR